MVCGGVDMPRGEVVLIPTTLYGEPGGGIVELVGEVVLSTVG